MWRDIKGWESLYEVNDCGDVRNKKTNKLIKGDVNSSGYYRVCLYSGNSKQRFFRHRLVAQSFIENPDNYKEVNHIDGDKSNNSVHNLEWCSRQHNERESRRIGIKDYKPFTVVFDNGTVRQYECTIDLANELNVTKRTVQNYLQHKSSNYIRHNISSIEYT